MLGGLHRAMSLRMWWRELWLWRRGGGWESGFVVRLCGVVDVLWMLIGLWWLGDLLRGCRDRIVVRVVGRCLPSVREL